MDNTLLIVLGFAVLVGSVLAVVYSVGSSVRTAVNELYTVLDDDAKAALVELKNHIQRMQEAATADTAYIRYAIDQQAGSDWSHVLNAKADVLAEVQKLHAKVEAIPAEAHSAARQAVADVMTATRRTCAYCNRLVHSFLVEAGVVKCTDCKAKEDDPNR